MQKKAGDITHTLCGQTLHLMPERCVFWQEERALLAADLHLGKEGTFRAAGIPLPDGPSLETLERLKLALERTGARRLFILGDLFHGENAVATVAPIMDVWRHNHPLAIDLISGSHDQWSGELPKAWQI
ncbi:MAG: DEAD/DEAH box helicase, partial [Deltaproteobacteria bacterium]|nr:DEAD/DEAH box helicase [Deltaproteobacteria bacterium]